MKNNNIKQIINEVISESTHNRYYMETYIDGEQKLGKEGTTVLSKINDRLLKDFLRNRVITLIGLSTVKSEIKNAESVIIKLKDQKGNTIKQYDVSSMVLSSDPGDGQF